MSQLKKRYTEPQVVVELQQTEQGTLVTEVIRKMGMSEATFYRWKRKYSGMGVKIGAKVVRQSRYVTFQMAEVAIDKRLFAEIQARIERLRYYSA